MLPAGVPPTHRLSTPDLLIVGVYLAAITLFGLSFRSKSRSLKGYFLADRQIAWWAIALSIVAAETSTLTIISVPGLAFTGDWGFLQIVLGYLLGRIVVCLLFLPRYFRGELLTAYEVIGQRFGPRLHKLTAFSFLFLRAAAEGVRVFAVSIVIGIAVGTNDVLSIAIICALTLVYTLEGGMAAVIWTDVVQMGLYIVGTIISVFMLGHAVPGGWHAIHTMAAAAGKLTIFHFAFSLTATYTFWAGAAGGCFLTMASHGTDQLMVQRLLAAKDLRESRIALLSSGVVILVQFVLFLAIGTGLYFFYAERRACSFHSGSSLPVLHRERYAAWNRRADGRGNPGGSYVQPQCRRELSQLQQHGGFLSSMAPCSRRTPARPHIAFHDPLLGRGAFRPRIALPWRRPCRRSRPFHRLSRLRVPPRSLLARHTQSQRHRIRCNDWDDRRFRRKPLSLEAASSVVIRVRRRFVRVP